MFEGWEGWEDVLKEINEMCRKTEMGEPVDAFAARLLLETFGWSAGLCEKPKDVMLASKAGLARWKEELERRKQQARLRQVEDLEEL